MTTRSLTFETFEAGMKGMCHRPLAGSHGRKDVFAVAGNQFDLFQYFNALTGQRDYVGILIALIRYTPLVGLQVTLPFYEKLSNPLGVDYRGVMLLGRWKQNSDKRCRRVLVAQAMAKRKTREQMP